MPTITQNDPRGEYWLYTDDVRQVHVGRGAVDGVCVFNTSDICRVAGPPLDGEAVAEILAEMMAFFGTPPGGYRKLALMLDGQFALADNDLLTITAALAPLGFTPRTRQGDACRWEGCTHKS